MILIEDKNQPFKKFKFETIIKKEEEKKRNINKITINESDVNRIIKSNNLKRISNQNSNPLFSLSECFKPIYDSQYGCAGSDQKASCFSSKLSDSIKCLFTGLPNDSYLLQQGNKTNINCLKEDGYTFEEVSKLRSCVNTSGYVTNNICTTNDGFCDCEGSGVDLLGNPTFKPYKIWNESKGICECDLSSNKRLLSEDQQCCYDHVSNLKCSEQDPNARYDCNSEACVCITPYHDISLPGDTEIKCSRLCTSSSQNEYTDTFKDGGWGCRTEIEILPLYDSFRLGGTDDLCCDDNACVLETNISKTSAINSNTNLWFSDANSTNCPRTGSVKSLICNNTEGLPEGQSQCLVAGIPSFEGFCKEGSCFNQCESECGVGNCETSYCTTDGGLVPYQNDNLYRGDCRYTCKP